MKILIEEKDETQTYRIVPIEQLKAMTKIFPDSIVLYVPNLCGGETRITIYKSETNGHPDNLKPACSIGYMNELIISDKHPLPLTLPKKQHINCHCRIEKVTTQ